MIRKRILKTDAKFSLKPRQVTVASFQFTADVKLAANNHVGKLNKLASLN